MNEDLKDNSFDELLGAALEDYVDDQPRPGFDRRILANLPARRLPLRWPLWGSVATASAVVTLAITLHLDRSSTPALTVTAALAHHGLEAIGSQRAVGGSTRPHAMSRAPVRGVEANTLSVAAEPPLSTLEVPASSAEAQVSMQTQPAVNASDGDVKIEPIRIVPLVIPPLSREGAAKQLIPPIKLEAIHIAPIQISRLEIDRPDSSQ